MDTISKRMSFATKMDLLEFIRATWRSTLAELDATRADEGLPPCDSPLDVYEAASARLPPDDDLVDLACWAFFQAVHSPARNAGIQNDRLAQVQRVSMELFDRMMTGNLDHPSWIAERAAWINTPMRPLDIH